MESDRWNWVRRVQKDRWHQVRGREDGNNEKPVGDVDTTRAAESRKLMYNWIREGWW